MNGSLSPTFRRHLQIAYRRRLWRTKDLQYPSAVLEEGVYADDMVSSCIWAFVTVHNGEWIEDSRITYLV